MASDMFGVLQLYRAMMMMLLDGWLAGCR